MASWSVLLALLVVRFSIETVSSLQIGPFTIPSLDNGGAFGFTNRLFNASIDPSSGRAIFGAQAPLSGFGGPTVTPTTLINAAERFRNSASSFVPNLSNQARTFTAIPGLPSYRSVFQPSGGSHFNTNFLHPFTGGQRNPLPNTANAFWRLATNTTHSVLNPAGGFDQLAQLIPGSQDTIEQFTRTIETVADPHFWSNLSSNSGVNLSPERAAKLSEGFDSVANGIVKVLANIPDVGELATGRRASGDRKDPHYYPGRTVMVHLFEWKFDDIADECERFLGPAGYGGVQVSPVNEYVVALNRPWWERYQPISYEIRSRSGNERQFAEMVRRCQRAGVRIYVDVVVNHMAAPAGTTVPLYGTAGSPSDPQNRLYPAVPYNRSHFHPDCTITNYRNETDVRICALGGLPDLDQSEPYVQDRIVEFMNRLIELGVAGFRMDASKHMYPADLDAIYRRLNALNPLFEFPPFAAPFIYQEVIDLGHETITASQYTNLGEVTEFKYSLYIGLIFRGALEASALTALTREHSAQYGMIPSESAFVFVDNHDNQRGHGAGGDSILTYKDGSRYVQAIAFTLATDYGTARIMSSYAFVDASQGPPADELENIKSPGFIIGDDAGSCENAWICEHRWPAIRRMVGFRNFVDTEPLTNVQAAKDGAYAFCRGDIGFAVFNPGKETYNGEFRTCLPAGEYCDLLTGERQHNTECSGVRVLVRADRTVSLTLPAGSSVVLDLRNRVA